MASAGRPVDAGAGVTAFLGKRRPHSTLRPRVDMPPFDPWWDDRSFWPAG